jgi:hypothetical protein
MPNHTASQTAQQAYSDNMHFLSNLYLRPAQVAEFQTQLHLPVNLEIQFDSPGRSFDNSPWMRSPWIFRQMTESNHAEIVRQCIEHGVALSTPQSIADESASLIQIVPLEMDRTPPREVLKAANAIEIELFATRSPSNRQPCLPLDLSSLNELPGKIRALRGSLDQDVPVGLVAVWNSISVSQIQDLLADIDFLTFVQAAPHSSPLSEWDVEQLVDCRIMSIATGRPNLPILVESDGDQPEHWTTLLCLGATGFVADAYYQRMTQACAQTDDVDTYDDSLSSLSSIFSTVASEFEGLPQDPIGDLHSRLCCSLQSCGVIERARLGPERLIAKTDREQRLLDRFIK